MKKKVLWVSPFAPYDNIGHASGKIENFYIKNLKKTVPDLDIELICLCLEEDRNKLDLDQYGIRFDIEFYLNDKKSKIIRTLKYNGFESKYNIWNKYANYVPNFFKRVILSKIASYKERNKDDPDIVILQWTSTVLLIKEIKKMLPNSKFICIEEDVAYLSYYRHIHLCKSFFGKKIWEHKYKRLKQMELEALSLCNVVICNNVKDKNLLLSDHVSANQIFVWCPYFYDFRHIHHCSENKSIIYYGAMSRPENYLSVIWFIENVFVKFQQEFNLNFLIIGSNPPPCLLKYQSEHIKVIGFVDDISSYFERAVCMVAPLVLGAGIKIKVLEAMSAGLPVLTNEIGIEGIPAKDGIEYFMCAEPETYKEKILALMDKKQNNEMSYNAQQFIRLNFDIEHSLKDFAELVENM